MSFRSNVISFVKNLISEVIQQKSEDIDSTKTFESFGMDSVLLMELQSKLSTKIEGVSKTVLFEYDTADKLTDHLIRDHSIEVKKILGISLSDETELNSQVAKPAGNTKLISNIKKEPKSESNKSVSIDHLFKKRANRNLQNTDNSKGNNRTDCSIVGMAGVFPNAKNISEFWNNIKNGTQCINEIPENRWGANNPSDDRPSKLFSQWGGFIEGVYDFDYEFFNLSKLEAAKMDPQLRLLLQTAWHAIEDAGYTPNSLKGHKVGVFVGAMNNDFSYQISELYQNNGLYGGAGAFDSELANRLSFFLNLHGPSFTVKSACSSSLTALHLACNAIKSGDCDTALVAGVNLSLHSSKYLMLQDMKVLSMEQYERTFDSSANGLVPSEGVGVLVLKGKELAIRDHDQIYVTVKGSSVSHSGTGAGQYIPNIKVLEQTIREAVNKSEININNLSYIESHGTATNLGDPIELKALENAISDSELEQVYIGTKANLGHMESASGICALMKVVLSMKYQTLAPCSNLHDLNEAIDKNSSKLKFISESQAWKRGENETYVAGVNSFGMGGSNAFIVLESETENTVSPLNSQTNELVVLSAPTEKQLEIIINDLVNVLDSSANLSLKDIAWTSQIGREEFNTRLAIICTSNDELRNLLTNRSKPDSTYSNLVFGIANEKNELIDLLKQGNQAEAFVNSLIADRKLYEIAQLWVKGIEIDWLALANNQPEYKVSLNLFPFNNSECDLRNMLEELKSQEEIKNLSYAKAYNQLQNTSKKPITWFKSVSNKTDANTLSQFSTKSLWRDLISASTPESHLLNAFDVNDKTVVKEFNTESRDSNIASLGKEISGSGFIDLMTFSSNNHIELQTIAIATWSMLLNRYTKNMNPMFSVMDKISETDEKRTADAIPFTTEIPAKMTVSEWLQQLQVEWDSHRSNLSNEKSTPKFLGDTCIVFNFDSTEFMAKHTELNFALGVNLKENSISVSVSYLNVFDNPNQIENLLTNFCSVMSWFATNSDRGLAATPVNPGGNKKRRLVNRLEEI